MATKKPKSYDLYAQQYRNKFSNALSQAQAIAAQEAEETGTLFTEEQVTEIARQIARTGNFDVAVPSETEETKDVPVLPSKNPSITGLNSDAVNDVTLALRAGSSSVASGLIGLPVRAINAITDPLPARLGRGLVETILGEDSEAVKRSKALSDLLRVDQPEAVREVQGGISQNTEEEFSQYASDVYKEGRKRYEDAKGFLDTAKTMITDPRTTMLMGIEQIPALVLGRVRGSTAGTVAAQSALAGANTEAEVASELAKKVAAGEMTREEAESIASTAFSFSAGMNAGVALLPGATVLDKAIAGTSVPKSALLAAARSNAKRKAATGLVGEGISGGLSEAGDQIISNIATGKPWDEDAAKQFATGAILEGPLGGATGAIEGRRERALYDVLDADAMASTGLENLLAERDRVATAEEDAINKALAEELSKAQEREPADTTTDSEKIAAEEDAAWEQRKEERKAETQAANREDLRRSVVARVDTARQEVEALQERIEAGDVDSATLNAAVAANRKLSDAENDLRRMEENFTPKSAPETVADRTPEQAVDEQELARQREAAKAEEEALAPYNAALLKEMEAERKRKERAEAKKTAEQKAAERKRQREVARQLLAENPGKDITELAPLLRDRLAQPEVAATDTVTPNQDQEVTDVQETVEQTEEAQQQVDSTTDEVPTEPANFVTGDTEVDNFLGSLKMEAPSVETVTAADPDIDVGSYVTQLRELGRRLSRRSTPEAVGTQNLVRTGKLIVAPTAASVGRDTDAAADYDTSTGKMYMYLDKLKDGDDVGAMIKALHEATHAGQFNPREGRGSVLESIMGRERYDAAQARVRAIARKQIREGKQGPERKALEQAQAAAKANKNFNGDVEALEVMPYYVGNTVGNRAAMSGVRSVAKDIVGAGRKFLRDRLGIDLDVNMQDIDYASRQVANEIVNTDIQVNPEAEGNLEMIIGRQGTDYQKKKAEGKVLRGKVDNQPRYEISDSEAEIATPESDPYTWEQLMAGETVPLDAFLLHDELYRQYPDQASEVKVNFRDLGPNYGMYNPDTRTVTLSKSMMLAAKDVPSSYERARNTTLHEVQHDIQAKEGFVPGTNPDALTNRSIEVKYNEARDTYLKVLNRFDLGRAIKTLPPTVRRVWDNELKGSGVDSRTGQAKLFLDGEYLQDVTDRLVKAYGPTYTKARQELDTATDAWVKERERARNLYLRDRGEMEARNTEYRSRMTADELTDNPEDTMKYAEGNIPIEEALDTTPYLRGRRPTSSSLGMEAEPDTSRDRTLTEAWKEYRFPKWMYDVFSTKQGMDPNIRAAIEAAKASPSGDMMVARATAGKYEAALRKLAVTRGTTAEDLNSQIEKDLMSLKPQGSWAANKAAFNAMASKYGKAGEYLQELRNQADSFSMEMLKQRAVEGGRTTKSERDSYKAIAANLGIYTHRQYAAMSGKAGSEFSEKVWDDYERDKRDSAVTSVKSKNYEIVAKATERIIDDSLLIPEDEKLATMGTDRLRRMYGTWVGPSEGITDSEMRTALAAKRIEITPERLQTAAEQIAKELLGLVDATSPITSYYRGAKLNTGILQKRTDMPKEIRDLLGEITDPMASMLVTIGKQAEFLARNSMLLKMREHVGRDLQPPGSLGTEAAQGMTELKGELWGPLEGYWASPNMTTMLGDMIQHIATFEQSLAVMAVRPNVLAQSVFKGILSRWVKGSNLAKMVQIVLNPMNFAYNYTSAYVSLALNGNWNPKNVVKGHRAMVQILANAANPDVAGEEAVRMHRLGITDSAFVGELKSGQYRDLETLIKKMSGKDVTVNKYLSAAHAAKKLGVEAYAMMDVWAKMANFYQQVDVLTDFHKKNGDSLTAEEIDRKAADIVNRTNITYKRAMPIVRAAESVSLTRFGTYMAEVFRSQVGNAAQAIDEYSQARMAKTPEAKQAMLLQATRRLGSQLAVWGMLGAVSSMLNSATFGEDDEEADKLRQLLPEYLRDQDFIKVGKDAQGYPVLFNISRAIDPIGPITDIMRTMINLEADPKDIAKKIPDLYVAPSLAGKLYQVVEAVVTGERPSRDPSVQQWFPEVYGNVLYAADMIPGVDDAVSRAVTNTVETLVLPGATNALRKNNPKVEDNEANAAFFGTMRFMGMTLAKLDPNEAVKYEARDYSDTLKNARREVGNLFKDRPSITVAEATDKILEISQREQEAFNKMRDLYLGMKAADLTDAEAAAILKENVQSVENVRAIMNDTFTSQAISKRSIDSFAANEMKGKTLEQKREIQQKWADVWDILSQVDSRIKEKK